MSTESASIKGIERTNTAVRNLRRQIGPPRRDSYAMDVDRERNCYNCEGFRHLARNCRNRGTRNRIGERRRLEYGNRRMIEKKDEQNRDRDLVVLN